MHRASSKIKFAKRLLEIVKILLRFISFLRLASFLYAATYFNEIETKTDPRNSFKVHFVSSQPQKGNLLKKHHYQEGLQLNLEEQFEESLSFLKPILNEEPILNARAI